MGVEIWRAARYSSAVRLAQLGAGVLVEQRVLALDDGEFGECILHRAILRLVARRQEAEDAWWPYQADSVLPFRPIAARIRTVDCGGGIGRDDDDPPTEPRANGERGARHPGDERGAAEVHPLAEIELEPERVGEIGRPERIAGFRRRRADDEPVDGTVVESRRLQELRMGVPGEIEDASPARDGTGRLGKTDDERFVLVQGRRLSLKKSLVS
jgi:hypothetical protein